MDLKRQRYIGAVGARTGNSTQKPRKTTGNRKFSEGVTNDDAICPISSRRSHGYMWSVTRTSLDCQIKLPQESINFISLS